jgi:hypothetical protein
MTANDSGKMAEIYIIQKAATSQMEMNLLYICMRRGPSKNGNTMYKANILSRLLCVSETLTAKKANLQIEYDQESDMSDIAIN